MMLPGSLVTPASLRLKSAYARRAFLLVLPLWLFSCRTETLSGGLMLVLNQDGSLQLDEIQVRVGNVNGDELAHESYRGDDVEDLPKKVRIASDQKRALSLRVSAWNGEVPLDVRDLTVLNVPADSVKTVTVLLSAKCSDWVKLENGEVASKCGSDETCDPATGACVSGELDGGDLPDFDENDEVDGKGGANGSGGRTDEQGSGGGLGSGGMGTTPTSVEQLGAACKGTGDFACDRNTPRQTLVCDEGKWRSNGGCDEGKACNPESGACAPILPGCADHEVGDRYCEGDDLISCGVNLVNAEFIDTCQGLCITTTQSAECASASCGDGKEQSDEVCDDGNDNNDDDCTELCKEPYCGDGFQQPNEDCDDADNDNVDGCTKSCVRGPTAVAAGGYHTCAVWGDRTVRCWGHNNQGQLGGMDLADHSTPGSVEGLSDVSELGLGFYQSCALKRDGTVMCWGDNVFGQLGDGSVNSRSAPEPVEGLSDVSKVRLGNYHSCALMSEGTVMCWGRNTEGQLGDGSTNDSLAPDLKVALAGDSVFSGVLELAVGSGHSCAQASDGAVMCWGYNYFGQLGNGTNADQLRPALVPGLTGVAALSLGGGHSCALKDDGTVMCWGYNESGQVGDGSTTDRVSPVRVSGLTGVSQLALGSDHSCALKDDGTVMCWGFNDHGELGDDSDVSRGVPTQVTGLTGVSALSLGGGHSCALKDDGTVMCWGNNYFGQLGNGSTEDQFVPVRVQF